MSNEENRIIRLQIYHQIIGIHNLQVNSKDNFSDLRALLQQNTPMAIFENFRFQLSNKTLPEFQQIGQVIQSDAKITLILQPFDEKSILFHLQKVKNIFTNPIQWALLNYNQEQGQQYPQINDTIKEELFPGISVDNFLDQMYTSPLHLPASKIECLIGNSTFSQQNKLKPNQKSKDKQKYNLEKLSQCEKWQFVDIFTFSQFNLSLLTTNFHRKMCGDIFYLHIRTFQAKDIHVTACAQGFFINSSSCTHFNPNPANPYLTYYNLLDLLKTISPKFRETYQKLKQIKFSQIQKSLFISFHLRPQASHPQWLHHQIPNKQNRHPYNHNLQNNALLQKSIHTPSLASFNNSSRLHSSSSSSLSPSLMCSSSSSNTITSSNIAVSSSYCQLQHNTSIIKDWNEILQIHMTTPYDTESELVNKNKLRGKLYEQMISLVTHVAVRIVEGIMDYVHVPENKTRQYQCDQCANNKCVFSKINKCKHMQDQHVYQYGSLQFWVVEDSINKYQTFEGSMKSKKAVNTQIRNLDYLQKFKINDLYYRHLILIKYKGYNVAAQTRIPGQPLRHNILDHRHSQIATTSDDNKNSKVLPKIERDNVLLSVARTLKLSQKILYTKHKDINNQISKAIIHPEVDVVMGSDNRKYLLNLYGLSARDLNFAGPQNSASYLRHELLELYNAQPQSLYTPPFLNKYRKTPLNTVLQTRYSVITNEKKFVQKQKLIQLATFAKQIMLPICLKSFQNENRRYLGDSKTVIKVMHAYGLSSRYLGLIWDKAIANKNLQYIAVIIERVTIVKSLKNIFKKAMRQRKSGQYKTMIAWLLNCIFNSELFNNQKGFIKSENNNNNHQKDQDKQKDESQTTHSKKRKKKNEFEKLQKQFQDNYFSFKINKVQEGQISYGIKPEQLWQLTKKIACFKFGLELKAQKISQLMCFRSCHSKSAILRDLCLSLGIVIERVEYFRKQKKLLRPQNILEIRPIVKHIKLQNQHFDEMYKQAQKLLQSKKIQQAIDAYIKAIHFAMLNLGVITQKFVLIHKKLSTIYFRIGQIDASLLFAHHAQKMLEQFYGADHIQTLQNYSMLSQLYFVKRKFNVAEYYLMKMINMAMGSYGEEYPQLISCFLNLSAIYLVSEKYIDAISCGVKALNLSLKISGQYNINTAICYASMSQIHFQIPDIQKSIIFQLKTLEILSRIVNKSDSRLKQAETTLQYYRSLQTSKKVKQNHEKQRKKLLNNQLYTNFPLFKMPEMAWRQRQNIHKKMQNMNWNPNRPYL